MLPINSMFPVVARMTEVAQTTLLVYMYYVTSFMAIRVSSNPLSLILRIL